MDQNQEVNDKLAEFYAQRFASVVEFRFALSEESDRGCALFAAAYLDSALEELLFLSLVHTGKDKQDLFTGHAPLSGFSARITMAFYLGKISAATRRELNIIRSIRNKFAHDAKIVSLSDQTFVNQCNQLKYSFREEESSARQKFCSSVIALLATIHTTGLKAVSPEQMPDDVPSDEFKLDMLRQVKGLREKVSEKPPAT